MHRAAADGPNHSPGCFPQADAPWRTNRCIENGASGSSANNDSKRVSSSVFAPLLQAGEESVCHLPLNPSVWFRRTSPESQQNQRVGK